jgi:hypothetical protein
MSHEAINITQCKPHKPLRAFQTKINIVQSQLPKVLGDNFQWGTDLDRTLTVCSIRTQG